MRKQLIGVVVALAMIAAFPLAGLAAEEPGPIDLSGSDHETGNVGERVTLLTETIGAGDWHVVASATLFVPDPEGEFKNSQGCGVYLDGTQVGGAGGSSSLWDFTADGKEVTLDTYLVPPNWTDVMDVVTGPGTLTLECFIDQSHSGASHADREGMVATDTVLTTTDASLDSKDDCKDGGFADFGSKNQGQCIADFNHATDAVVPESKDDCRKGGHADFGFTNQGECIAAVSHAN